jgi:hypothetical protein
MIKARHAKVVVLRSGQVSPEIQRVDAVAKTITGEWAATVPNVR